MPSDPDLPPYQRKVADFVARHDLAAPARERLLDLAAEVGELAKELLSGSEYGRRDLALSPAWSDELGDAFFSLVCLANATGVDLEQALSGALAKYERRLGREGHAGSGR